MRVLTSHQAKFVDSESTSKFSMSSTSLMDEAGKQVAAEAKSIIGNNKKSKVWVFCGKGNNGGDGFAASHYLFIEGFSVCIYYIGNKNQIKGDSLLFFKKCTEDNIPIEYGKKVKATSHPDLIIDAIVGVGLNGTLRRYLVPIFELINRAKCPVLSVDIPSGLDSNTGERSLPCIKADVTASFFAPKLGMQLRNGPEHTGRVVIKDIGLPPLKKFQLPGLNWHLTSKSLVENFFQKTKKTIDKYEAGRVLVIAGSVGMSGAAILSTYGALRSGAGLTLTTSPSSMNAIYEQTIIEGITLSLDDDGRGLLKNEHYDIIMEKVQWADSVLMGPGLGRDPSTQDLILRLVSDINKPLILDADGLYPFKNNLDRLCQRKHPLLITPHFRELSRLIGVSKDKIISNFVEISTKIISPLPIVTLIKQVPSCICYDKQIRLNTKGNQGLATAGTGDVLSGVIASIVAQGLNCFDGATVGAYVHGEASDILIKKKGIRGQIASDLLDTIPSVIKSYEKS